MLEQDSVRLDYEIGRIAPGAQIKLTASAATARLSFTANESCSWLDVSPKTGTTPSAINLTVTPSGLAPNNTYQCVINVSAPEAQKPSQTITVTLNTQAAPTVTPDSLNYAARQGSTTPIIQTLSLTGPATPVAFTATASSDSGGNWLTVSPASGRTPATLSVLANPSGLNQTRYTGKITVAVSGLTDPITVLVVMMLSPVTVSVVPNRLSFRYEQGSIPTAQAISVVASDASTPNFIVTTSNSLTFTRAAGSSNVIVSPAQGLPQGVTGGTVTISATGGTPPSQTIPVTIVVDPPPVANPILTFTPSAGFTFSLVQGANPRSDVLSIANQGGGALNFTVAANTRTGGNWLDVSCPQARTSGSAPVPCSVTADPSKVIPNADGSVAGTYTGDITLQGDQSARIPVTLTVNARPNILLAYSGLNFTVLRGGNHPPEQAVQILSGGAGTLTWNAAVNTIGGGDWLKVDTVSGTATSSAAGSMNVTIDPKAFSSSSAGARYGSIVVAAVDESGTPAANSPRTIGVVVNVLDSTAHISPVADTSGLIFTADAGDDDVASQFVTISNLSGSAIGYTTAVVTNDGGGWCSASPANGSVAQTATLAIDVDYAKLKAGLYSCELRIIFEDGSVQNVIIAARAATAGAGSVGARAADASRRAAARAANPNCKPNNQPWTVVLSKPSPNDNFFVGQGINLEVAVQDYCGNYVDNQAVSVNTSASDKGVTLLSVGRGVYQATLNPPNLSSTAAQSVILLAAVASPSFASASTYTQGGNAPLVSITIGQPPKPSTVVDKVTNAASFSSDGVVAPCSWVSIFGDNLADTKVVAADAPLLNQLANASAQLGAEALPLDYVAENQINAQIPCGLVPNTQHDLLVLNGDTPSLPQQLVVAESRPAIYTVNQQGYGQAAAFWTTPAGAYVAVDRSNPAAAGSIIEIYATGLGETSPKVAEGVAAPVPPATVVRDVSVTIGGIAATVTFAGLAPGLVGVYQVNAVVPKESAGDELPVVITVGNQVSQSGVTIAVR